MTFNLTHIEFSSKYKKRNIKIPTKLDEQLAEFIGVMIGDGHLSLYKYNGKVKNYEIQVVGHIIDDKAYLNYVNELFYKLFNVNFHKYLQIKNNAMKLRINSKSINFFLHKNCEIPLNKKAGIVKIPKIIFDSSIKIKYAFLRGLGDTDFSFSFKKKHKNKHYYPVIKGTFASKYLVSDLSVLFNELKFKNYTSKSIEYDKRTKKNYSKYSVFLSGNHNLNKWINYIGFSNKKHIMKTNIWKKQGFVPPYLTFNEKEKIIAGKLNPAIFYGIGNE